MVTALITGAAGGLGARMVERLLENDFDLILVDKHTQRLDALQKDVASKYTTSNAATSNPKSKQSKRTVNVINCDVADYAALKKNLAAFKQIDVLINAAGELDPVGPFAENNIEVWAKTIGTNLLGTVNACHICLERLKKSKHGKIINFAGGGAAYGRVQHTAYASSKAAVVRFTETLASEEPKLDVNVIAPGAHNTFIWESETYDKPPLKWADPRRFQDLIQYLATDTSNGLTGRFMHIYDEWDKSDYRTLSPDMLTLRRIDEQLLKKLK